ncbi:unnamed protein product, partial [Nesidiocoris tenuis]
MKGSARRNVENSTREKRRIVVPVMSEIKTEIIFDVLSNCRNLTDLTLKRTQFDRPEQFFRDLSTVGNKLTKINLNHNMQLGSVELSDMIEALNKMDDIRIHSLFFDRWISSR